jgi:two-component sensor histidine kinase
MAERIVTFDWTGTSLGPIDSWSRSLMNVLRTVLASRQPICFWWGPELLQIHNDDYLPMLADRADRALGAPFKELWADVWADVSPFVDEAMNGRGTWAENLPLNMVRGGAVERTFWTFSYSPLYDDHGQIAGLMNIVTETTDAVRDRAALAAEVQRANAALAAQREAERQQRLLQHELSHRMKNTLAMVQAVVSQSLKRANDIDGGARLASERIQALGRAHDTLTNANWENADIREVIDAAVRPHRDRPERIRIKGESVSLTAQQALGLSLAVHELSTNAVKYGALSTDQGWVQVAWSISDDGAFSFQWVEQGGPRIETPERKGFGSRLTTRAVPTYFDGNAAMEFRPEGLVYALSGRLTGVGQR